MKKSIQIIATALVLLFGNSAVGQDSVYVVKNGIVTHAIKQSDVDSIIFYRPMQSITDSDGNVYKTVTIGTQIWMAENLKSTKYSNGDLITRVTSNFDWTDAYTNNEGGWCYHSSDASMNSVYGKLYNYHAVMDSRNVCPSGWSVPTRNDYEDLFTYLGGDSIAGKPLRSNDNLWNNNGAGTNSSGFTALPGGSRYGYGGYGPTEANGNWWTKTNYSLTEVYYMAMGGDNDGAGTSNVYKEIGLSVRCIKN